MKISYVGKALQIDRVALKGEIKALKENGEALKGGKGQRRGVRRH